jgi:hypothetical protein
VISWWIPVFFSGFHFPRFLLILQNKMAAERVRRIVKERGS